GTGPQHHAGVDHVLISKDVDGERLHIESRCDAVSEIHEEIPMIQLEDLAANLEPVSVRIDESRHHEFSGNVAHDRASRHIDIASRPNASDLVVHDHNVRVPQNFIASHRNDGCTSQHHRTFRDVALQLDDCV